MNVYDFDGTIYNGDSSIDFYLFCLKEYPSVRRSLFETFESSVLYLAGTLKKTEYKERYFSFLTFVPDIDIALEHFWDDHEHKIKTWYLRQKKESDLVISASPEFLLEPICKRLNIKLIASRVNKNTGIFEGLNCRDFEKVQRLEQDGILSNIDAFYSDSLADQPLARKISDAYMVRGDEIIPWSGYKQSMWSRAASFFLTPQFARFIFVGGCATLVNFGLSLLYSLKIDETLAFVGGYFSSLIVSYLLNATLNFKRALSFNEFIKFVISYVPHFILLILLVAFLLDGLGMGKVLVYGLASLLGVPISFALVKIYAFKKQQSD